MSPNADSEVPHPGVLYLLVGPWASGKTTILPHLTRHLPEHVVFGWDAIIPGLSSASGRDVHTDPSTWDGLRQTWLAVVGSVLTSGRSVVLCGPLQPADVDRSQLPRGEIRCAYLDCPDELLDRRLTARGVDRQAIVDELSTGDALRRSAHFRISAGDEPPEQIAAQVIAWIHR
jgi:hypothetical protein